MLHSDAEATSGQLTMPGGDISTGIGDLTLVSGATLSIPGILQGANISLSGANSLALDFNITANGTLALTSTSGNITQAGGVIVSAGTLTGSSTGSTTLTGTSLIGTLGGFSAAGLTLSDGQTLTVTGPVTGGASTSLTTTAGNLAINGALSSTTTTLTSRWSDHESAAGVIAATTLTWQLGERHQSHRREPDRQSGQFQQHRQRQFQPQRCPGLDGQRPADRRDGRQHQPDHDRCDHQHALGRHRPDDHRPSYCPQLGRRSGADECSQWRRGCS